MHGADVVICGRVYQLLPSENTVIIHDQDSPYTVVQAVFEDTMLFEEVEQGQYILLYGSYGGLLLDYELELEGAEAHRINAVTYELFVADETMKDRAVDEAFLTGTWMMHPSGTKIWSYVYEIDEDYCSLDFYIFDSLSIEFDGNYYFSKPNRMHHRYRVKSYHLETGELLGEFTGRLNYNIEPINQDMVKIDGGIFFRIAQ